MPINVDVSGNWKYTITPSVKIGAAWKAVTDAWTNIGGVWKRCFGPLTVSLNLTYAPDQSNSHNHAISVPVTATINEGIPPYSYGWVYVSGDTRIVCDNPNNLTTQWQVNAAPGTYQANWQFKVTDNRGTVVYSISVQVYLIITY